MAIFSRRTIQRLINENATIFYMPVKEQIKVLNRKENAFNNEFLAREWEIVVLNTFAKTFANFGKVTHEKKFNNKVLDIFFESSKNPKLNFVADICTVSDFGTDEKFPIEELERRFYKLIHEKGLNPNLFNIQVGDNSRNISRESGGIVLYLPNRKLFDEKVFNSKFISFLESVESNLSSTNNMIINEVDFKIPNKRKINFYTKFLSWCLNSFHKTKIFKHILRYRKFRALVNEFAIYTLISISYTPNQRFSFKIVNNHKRITLLENNTLFYRLKDKYEQLKNSQALYPKGIIICDGDYNPFFSLYSFGTPWTSKHYEAKDIINHFFKKPNFQEIDFILFFGVNPYGEDHKIISKFFVRPREKRLDDLILGIFKSDSLISNVPKPQRSVGNALNHLKSKYKNVGSKIGGIEVSSNKIKVSSRAILEILAGETDIQDFTKIHSHPLIGNPFKTKLKEGRLITSIEVEKAEDDKDDEILVFNFGEADVAISNFKKPNTRKSS